MNTASEIITIPLNKLVPSSRNVRKTGGQSIEDLAASIKAHGLIHNLVVTKAVKGDKHEVIAGARRLAALQKLAKEKVLPKTFEVPCRVIDADASTETSLADPDYMSPEDRGVNCDQISAWRSARLKRP